MPGFKLIKMGKSVFFMGMVLFAWFMLGFSLPAQEPCKVLVPELVGEYEGGCRNGLAHGRGVAVGEDRYEGQFREGLPHGRGTYTWSDGRIYEGRWRDGQRDGRGTFVDLHDGEYSTTTGVWQADTFLRERRVRPYTVGVAFNMERYTVRKIADEPNRVMVTLQQGGTQNRNVRNFTFLMDGTGQAYTSGDQTGYQDVDFPAQCRISYETPDLFRQVVIRVLMELTINEPGDWLISIYN